MSGKQAHKRDTSGLASHAQRKAQEAREKVIEAVDRLLAEQKPVNFSSVAREANTTRSFIYRNPELREAIAFIEKLQERAEPLFPFTEILKFLSLNREEADNRTQETTQEKHIRLLEAENQRLKEELNELRDALRETLGRLESLINP